MTGPSAEVQEQRPGPSGALSNALETARTAVSAAQAAEDSLANLATWVLFGVLGAWLASALEWISVSAGTVGIVAGALLIPIVVLRMRRARAVRRGRYTLDWLEARVRRRADDYAFEQDHGAEYRTRDHRYAYDLDLFGPGSVFERLNATHTPIGRDALAAWLLGRDQPGTPLDRQAAVIELMGREDERRRFEVSLRHLMDQPGHNPTRLAAGTRSVVAWGRGPSPEPTAPVIRFAMVVLPLLNLAGIAAWIGLGWPWWVAALPYGVSVFAATRVPDLKQLMTVFEGVQRALRPWADVVEAVASFRFDAPLLQGTVGRVGQEHAPDALRDLGRLVDRLSQRRNAFWALTGNVVLLSDVRARHGLARWHTEHGPHLADWLEATGEMEAWASLATWAESLHTPAWPVIQDEGPWLSAEQLAHPLLSADHRVGNDATLAERGALWVVTGSNMSGKSTFLRALGLGALFAELGLPVVARSLQLRPLALATSMKVEESLQRGSSRFHAEVQRLARCMEWARQGPCLVLLDEILAGTNSKERRLGTAAVLRELGELETITLVSTHDLGLADVADQWDRETRVVHFTDRIVDGRMVFDYTVKEGPLPSTNALAVMRAEGIDVEA